jgi:transposase
VSERIVISPPERKMLESRARARTPAKEIHIIADNLSAHRTSKVWEFLERNRNVRIHYTQTYSSWLNQVEIWFSKIQRDVIARGIFASVKDLDRKLIRYIRSYNKKAKPFKWTYTETQTRIRTTKKSM